MSAESSGVQKMKRYSRLLHFFIVLLPFSACGGAYAQNLENGQRLSERWCAECHTIGTAPGKREAPSFAAIAAKEKITAEMIASFLLMPHATMPNPPLRQSDTRDIAAYIMGMKK